MAKQKVVVKVTMSNEKKTRKALKIAVSICGVESVSFIGSDKNQIAVTGEGIDSVQLTTLLRKGVGYTELVSVGPVEEKKPDAPKSTAVPPQVHPYGYYYSSYGMPYYIYMICEISSTETDRQQSKPIKTSLILINRLININTFPPSLLILANFECINERSCKYYCCDT